MTNPVPSTGTTNDDEIKIKLRDGECIVPAHIIRDDWLYERLRDQDEHD